MTEWLAAVGMRVRLARVARGETQEELGCRAGVSRVTVGSIERGEHPASVLAFRRLADALGVDLGRLLAPLGDRPLAIPVDPRRPDGMLGGTLPPTGLQVGRKAHGTQFRLIATKMPAPALVDVLLFSRTCAPSAVKSLQHLPCRTLRCRSHTMLCSVQARRPVLHEVLRISVHSCIN